MCFRGLTVNSRWLFTAEAVEIRIYSKRDRKKKNRTRSLIFLGCFFSFIFLRHNLCLFISLYVIHFDPSSNSILVCIKIYAYEFCLIHRITFFKPRPLIVYSVLERCRHRRPRRSPRYRHRRHLPPRHRKGHRRNRRKRISLFGRKSWSAKDRNSWRRWRKLTTTTFKMVRFSHFTPGEQQQWSVTQTMFDASMIYMEFQA